MVARPSSPTHAFDPTPALEHHPDNYSPLTHSRSMASSFDFRGGRLSDPSSLPAQSRHSTAASGPPLLSQVPSASQLPKPSYQTPNPTPGATLAVYMEQCQAHLKRLRQSHESERVMWETEANELRTRIAELEQTLGKKSNGKRRLSNELSNANLNSFGSNTLPVIVNGMPRGRMHSEPTISGQPVWKGPETTPPVTRVFTHDEDVKHLPSISEDGVSPTSVAQENAAVPGEQVDKSLDGITLKKAGLASSFEKKIPSPQFISPTLSPPPPKKDESLKLDDGNLLGPLDEKLKLHAGHTPRIFDGALSSDGTSSAITPKQEKPVDPAPTKRSSSRPSENSDSYFGSAFSLTSTGDESSKENQQEGPEPILAAPDDPALKGPLTLDPNANSAASASFLNELDAKLIEEKEHQERTESKWASNADENSSLSDKQEVSPEKESKDDDMPMLKMKQSTNFGSAWGGNIPGRMA